MNDTYLLANLPTDAERIEVIEKYHVDNCYNSDITFGVAAFIVNSEQKVLLLLRKKDPQSGCWTIPGGKVTQDESFQSAIVREVKEETGTDIAIAGLLTVTQPQDPQGRIWFSPVFLAKIVKGVVHNAEPDIHQQLDWFSLSDIPHNLNTTTQLAIAEYKRNMK